MVQNDKLNEFMAIEQETLAKIKDDLDQMYAVGAAETVNTIGHEETQGNVEPVEEP